MLLAGYGMCCFNSDLKYVHCILVRRSSQLLAIKKAIARRTISPVKNYIQQSTRDMRF